ncbi:Nuclear body protein SP140-like protein [Anabarilius grahami]|uniref:Nuclear body protein SP140-like protein n=1 Tax=Anabarilius grahami TaxID=495550 RepID=A0A3N0YAX1_ANAGA|nr:Nuclear body protein SP140-like protein [Anabarilius grahami]
MDKKRRMKTQSCKKRQETELSSLCEPKKKQATRQNFPKSDEKIIDSQDNDDEDDVIDMSVFEGRTIPVTCGSDSGILHKCRFAKGHCGRCIRTENFWLSPEDFIKLNKPDGTWRKDIVSHGMPLGKLITVPGHSENICGPMMLGRVKLNLENNDYQTVREFVSDIEYVFHHCTSNRNDDVCFACNSEGHLVCCDECPRAFHSHCHLPAADGDSLGSKWSCTFCVMKNMEDSSQKTQQEVLSSPLSQYTLVPGHSENICGPMMLGRVKLNLENNDYQTVREFVSDIEYVFHHCTSNRDNDFSRMTSRLKEMFETIFKLIQE